MDHPYVAAAAIGVVAGIAAVAISAVVTSVVTNVSATVSEQATARVVAQNAPKFTGHATRRMAERNVSPKTVIEVIKKGTQYYDPKYNTKVYHYGTTAVAVLNKGKGAINTVITKIPKPTARWNKLK